MQDRFRIVVGNLDRVMVDSGVCRLGSFFREREC